MGIIQNEKDSIKSQVLYTGKVTVQYKNKAGKIVKEIAYNKGDIGLFTFICRCLGGIDASKYAPFQIMGYEVTEDEHGVETAETKAFITMAQCNVSKTYYNNGEQASAEKCNTVRFTFRISPLLFSSTNVNIKRFKIFNKCGDSSQSEGYQLCNSLTLDSAIKPGTNTLIVYWDMIFSSNS